MRSREIFFENILVYHGSPHLFDPEEDAPHGRFRLDKIGSGEGVQVYGKGLYFAENPKVGQAYKNRLTAPKSYNVPMFLDDQPVSARNWVSIEREMWARDDAIGAALACILGDANRYNLRNLRQIRNFYKPDARGFNRHIPLIPSAEWAEVLRQLSKRVRMAPNRGVIYQVMLHADPDTDWLNWDRPLNQQPHLQGLLAAYGRPGSYIDPTWTTRHLQAPEFGGELFQAILADHGQDAAVSILRGAGLQGVKYLDKGSRPKGQGGYNYVVMNPAIIEILGKRIAR